MFTHSIETFTPSIKTSLPIYGCCISHPEKNSTSISLLLKTKKFFFVNKEVAYNFSNKGNFHKQGENVSIER